MNRKFIYIGCTVFAMSLLNTIGVQAQEQNDSLVNVAFGKVAQEDLTHAISTVHTSELTKTLLLWYSMEAVQQKGWFSLLLSAEKSLLCILMYVPMWV